MRSKGQNVYKHMTETNCGYWHTDNIDKGDKSSRNGVRVVVLGYNLEREDISYRKET